VRPHDLMSPSTLEAGRLAELAARLADELDAGGLDQPGAWQVPLLLAPEVEAWLLGWPAGEVTPAHDHGGSTVALTVVEGTLSEECLDPTIWTTGRRTTWRAGSTTAFPPGHVHVLGAAGGRPAVAVHAWSPGGAVMDPAPQVGPSHACSPDRSAARAWARRSADRGTALPGLGGSLGAGGGRRRAAAAAARGGAGRLVGGRAGQTEHPADGALDARHVGDRVSG
jgi:quercetin dioxygenase-like cupin family protein